MAPQGSQVTSEIVKVAAIQSRVDSNPLANFDNTVDKIREAAADGSRLICLQELFLSPYFCQTEDHRHFDLAEPVPGPTTQKLCSIAKKLGVVIVASLFERRAAGLYHNTAVVIDQGELAGKYRKMHIPDDPYYYEKFYFTPGDLGFQSFETSVGRVGVCVCWDQWFPEAARLTAMSGADFIVYPTAIGWLDEDKENEGEAQLQSWKIMLQSHAISNGVFVVAPNRVGREDHLEFWGNSIIVRPNGTIVAEADRENTTTIATECNRGEIEAARTHWPFLRDRRIDAYAPLSQRFIDAS